MELEKEDLPPLIAQGLHIMYRIAGKFDGELILVVLQLSLKVAN